MINPLKKPTLEQQKTHFIIRKKNPNIDLKQETEQKCKERKEL